MEINELALVGIAIMVLSLALIPLGLPGLWIMVGVVGIGMWTGAVSIWLFLVLMALVVLAELLEWFAVDRLGRKYGGTQRTFWGALAGGIVGAFVGTPVPVIGSLLGVFAGTMVGASIATWTLVKDSEVALRAGWGALLGRSAAIALKSAAGLVILVAGGAALLF
jgi:uncharacterized protein YqgC (DUF456 family)